MWHCFMNMLKTVLVRLQRNRDTLIGSTRNVFRSVYSVRKNEVFYENSMICVENLFTKLSSIFHKSAKESSVSLSMKFVVFHFAAQVK